MRLIIIHAATGDTVAGVVRFEELDMMGIKYTELIPYELESIYYLKGNPDLEEQASLLLGTCLTHAQFSLKE